MDGGPIPGLVEGDMVWGQEVSCALVLNQDLPRVKLIQ